MKIRILLLAALVACTALAQTPSVRLGNLRGCDSVIVKETGKDPYTVYGNVRVKEMLMYINVDSATVRGAEQGGKILYKLTFFDNPNKKPTDTLWVRSGGVWGFDKERFPYGKDDRLIPWLIKAKG